MASRTLASEARPVVPEAAKAPPGVIGRGARRLRSVRTESWIAFAVVAGCTVTVFVLLHPGLVFTDTTPTGGDLGAHVWGPAWLRDHGLASGWWTGWSPDAFGGFPVYNFYPVAPAFLVVFADVLLPYNVAFKLVVVTGLVALPIAAWAFGHGSRLRFPAPPLLAVAATLFVFNPSYEIFGGNVASTLAGEFSYQLGLVFALVYLGLLLSGLQTGRHRASCAVLLGLTVVCHPMPGLLAATGTIVALAISALNGQAIERARYVLTTGVVGFLLSAWWVVPFFAQLDHATSPEFRKRTDYLDYLFPRSFAWELVVGALALAGVIGAWRARRFAGQVLSVLAATMALAFVAVPQGHLWNVRLLPLWYLCWYLLAALGVAELTWAAARLWPDRAAIVARSVAPVAAILTVGALIAIFPGSRADGYVEGGFAGYERVAGSREYQGIVDTMRRLGRERGCGREMEDYRSGDDRYGSSLAFVLMPYWTDGCIRTMEGLITDASATAPYVYLTQSLTSWFGAQNVKGLPYERPELAKGVQQLRALGVRYYLAGTPESRAAAAAEPGLERVARSGPWVVYEVRDSAIVTPVEHEPVVLTGVGAGSEWQDASIAYYSVPRAAAVPVAADGLSEWRRIVPGQAPPETNVPDVRVSDVREEDDTVSFRVDRTGVPVLVRVSYFPNWQVEGAAGPYRVSPNFMLVVPTSRDVTLHYGRSTVEWLAFLLALIGVMGVALLWRRRPLAIIDDGRGPDEPMPSDRRARPEPRFEPPHVEPAPVATQPPRPSPNRSTSKKRKRRKKR